MSELQFESVQIFRSTSVEKKPFLLAPFYVLKCVVLEHKEPERFLLEYARKGARRFGFWQDEKALKNRFYKLYTAFMIFVLTVFWSTIAGDLFTATRDIAALGENLMFLMGVSVAYFKSLLTLRNWAEINEVIDMLKELWSSSAALQHASIKALQRNYFIAEVSIFLFFHVMALFLFATLSIQPLLSGQSMPIPALFPFNWQQAELYPWAANFVYVFQVLAIFYALLLILYLDTLGGASVTQTSLNLRILSVRLRALGLDLQGKRLKMLDELRSLVEVHQKIIAVNEKCNSAFHGSFLVQMGLSTFMLGLAGFETLYAQDQPMVAFKFLFFMCAAASQLLYWCMVGNMVYFDSQDVSIAAFEAHEWFDQSPIVQRSLMFVIFRAQKPLVFRAKPFMPFTFETFTKIIKTSYTSFTLLCNTSE